MEGIIKSISAYAVARLLEDSKSEGKISILIMAYCLFNFGSILFYT